MSSKNNISESLDFEDGLLPVKPNDWNPRFLDYCKRYGVSPDEMYKKTPQEVTALVGETFPEYIQGKWTQFYKEVKGTTKRVPYSGMHEEFDNWLKKNLK